MYTFISLLQDVKTCKTKILHTHKLQKKFKIKQKTKHTNENLKFKQKHIKT